MPKNSKSRPGATGSRPGLGVKGKVIAGGAKPLGYTTETPRSDSKFSQPMAAKLVTPGRVK